MEDLIDLDIYNDLDEFQAQEDRKSSELKAVEDKYTEALKTIENLKEEQKQLQKKLKTLEINFQNLFDTAKAEIRRKDKLIAQLRQEKDDICFRRQTTGNNFKQKETSVESGEIAPNNIESNRANDTENDRRYKSARDHEHQRNRVREREHDRDKSRGRDHKPEDNRSRDRASSRDRHFGRSNERYDRNRGRGRSRDREQQRSRDISKDKSDHRRYRNKSNSSHYDDKNRRSTKRERENTERDLAEQPKEQKRPKIEELLITKNEKSSNKDKTCPDVYNGATPKTDTKNVAEDPQDPHLYGETSTCKIPFLNESTEEEKVPEDTKKVAEDPQDTHLYGETNTCKIPFLNESMEKEKVSEEQKVSETKNNTEVKNKDEIVQKIVLENNDIEDQQSNSMKDYLELHAEMDISDVDTPQSTPIKLEQVKLSGSKSKGFQKESENKVIKSTEEILNAKCCAEKKSEEDENMEVHEESNATESKKKDEIISVEKKIDQKNDKKIRKDKKKGEKEDNKEKEKTKDKKVAESNFEILQNLTKIDTTKEITQLNDEKEQQKRLESGSKINVEKDKPKICRNEKEKESSKSIVDKVDMNNKKLENSASKETLKIRLENNENDKIMKLKDSQKKTDYNSIKSKKIEKTKNIQGEDVKENVKNSPEIRCGAPEIIPEKDLKTRECKQKKVECNENLTVQNVKDTKVSEELKNGPTTVEDKVNNVLEDANKTIKQVAELGKVAVVNCEQINMEEESNSKTKYEQIQMTLNESPKPTTEVIENGKHSISNEVKNIVNTNSLVEDIFNKSAEENISTLDLSCNSLLPEDPDLESQLHSMFKSPQDNYLSNISKEDDNIEDTILDDSCIMEKNNETTNTLNSSSETKQLTMGSSKYVFEKVSDNVIKLSITRRKGKKKKKTELPPSTISVTNTDT